jgi:hypothetical protein
MDWCFLGINVRKKEMQTRGEKMDERHCRATRTPAWELASKKSMTRER